MDPQIEKAYDLAKQQYAKLGVDTEKVMHELENFSISLHCWQGDDVGGFEKANAELSGGGIQATGNFPGKARTILELRQDIEQALNLIPGTHRVNIHAIYGEFGGESVDRDQIEYKHFQGWVDWAKNIGVKLDFNCSLFSHPKAEEGFTLSSKDPQIREFWIKHVEKCRIISEQIGKALGGPCIHNIWIPDGSKDIPVDRKGHRDLLIQSLNTILSQKMDTKYMIDALEGKLFGIGSESYVVGSHDFYLGYTVKNNMVLTMDMGHFHPTESVADKISAILPFVPGLLLHVSRGVRWDSDHVVIQNDDLNALTQEVIRSQAFSKLYLALDYFDASINRIGAWVTGTRATLKSLLCALLEPREILLKFENSGENFQRLGLLEELKAMPYGAVWDYYCAKHNVPIGIDWIQSIEKYQKTELSKRK